VFGYANVIGEMSDYTQYIGLSGNIDRQNTACRNCLEKPPRMFLFRNLVAYDFIMFGVNAVMRHRLTEPFRLPVKTPPSVSTAMAAHAIASALSQCKINHGHFYRLLLINVYPSCDQLSELITVSELITTMVESHSEEVCSHSILESTQ